MNITQLPETVIEIIMSYLPFDDIAKNRIVRMFIVFLVVFIPNNFFHKVCKKFNEINMNLLNHGFYTLLNCHARALKKIKAQLPRRESERRNHACKIY